MSEARKQACLALAGAVLIAAAGWLVAAGLARAAPNTVYTDPAAATVAPGGSTSVSLVAEAPAAGLGAWTIDVTFDPALVDATGCTPHAAGLCNPDFASNTVRATGASAQGVTGVATLAAITFQAVAGAGCTDLAIQVVTFTDPEGTPTSPTTTDGQLCVQAPTPTPVPTVTPTPQPTPQPTPTPVPTPTPTQQAGFPPAFPGGLPSEVPAGGGAPSDGIAANAVIIPAGIGLGLLIVASALWMLRRSRRQVG